MYLRRKVFSVADNYDYFMEDFYERAFSEGYEYAQREFNLATEEELVKRGHKNYVQTYNSLVEKAKKELGRELSSAEKATIKENAKSISQGSRLAAEENWAKEIAKSTGRDERGVLEEIQNSKKNASNFFATSGPSGSYRSNSVGGGEKKAAENWFKKNKKALMIAGGIGTVGAGAAVAYARKKKND